MDKKEQKLLSVCIPTYDMGGFGHKFLKHSFDILKTQTFKDFDVVISDYSKTNLIKGLCDEYKDRLNIDYFKNFDPVGGMSANTNNAIRHATGKLIKILFQDDFLYSDKSLEEIVKNFDLKKDKWLVTACEHSKDGITFFRPFYPQYNDKIHLGKNTISSPSVLTIKNDNPLLFDTKLKWLMDCDYYKRYYEKYGKPKILNKINVVNRVGAHQISNTEANDLVRKSEYQYILKKYNEKTTINIELKKVTLVAVSGINPKGAIRALELSMDGIDYYEVVLISHEKPLNLNTKIKFKQCKPSELKNRDAKNTNDYSKFIAYSLCEYIDSEFALIVHDNAFVLRPHKWNNEFLKYDYIGAPWPKNMFFTNAGINVRVGNGGFSLRSKKLLNALNKLKLPFTDNGTGFYHEDGIICDYYRKELENYGIKFAPVEVASMFSREKDCDDSEIETFGFHNNKKVIPRLFFFERRLKKLFRKI